MIPSKLPGQGISIFTVMSSLANECGAINLSQGFPGFDCDPVLKQYVYKYMKEGKNQYAPSPGIPELRAVLAEKFNSLYGRKLDMDREITITAGATQAIFTALSAFVQKGDEVILIEPAYDCYRPTVLLQGGVPVGVPMVAPDYDFPWDRIRKAITSKTRMLLLNSPQNPTGRVMSEEDFEQLRSIVLENDLILLSDEVYEHIVFEGKAHRPAVADPDLFERTLSVYSFGKVFHNTGWKTGYAMGTEKLMSEFRKVHQFNVFSVFTPVQYALADYLSVPERYLGISEMFRKKKDLFTDALKESSLEPLPCNGTYFLLCDYSRLSEESDREFAVRLTREAGVASIPLSPFYSDPPSDRVLRFCFAKEDQMLEEAAVKLVRYRS